MALSETKKGELAILSQVWLWGLFPIVTTLTYSALSPIVSLAAGTLLAALFFAFILSYKRKWSALKDTQALKDILMVALFTGTLYYVFYFFGLKYTTSGNAVLVAQMEVLFSFLFFQVWKKQAISLAHIGGALLMVLGAAIILFPKTGSWNSGDLLVLMAGAVAPFGNYFQQRARKRVSGEAIMFVRSSLAFPMILLIAYFTSAHVSAQALKQSWLVLAINGFVLLGFAKLLWIEGIHRISVTKAVSLGSAAPLFTLVFSYLILKQHPSFYQVLSFAPIALGLYLLVRESKPAADFMAEQAA